MKHLLLFQRFSDFLGEVQVRDGHLSHVMLTDRGEEAIGAAVKDWQTRGVPVRREVFGTRQNPNTIVFYQERIQPRDQKFENALRAWCNDRGLSALTLPSSLHMECWASILRLPLESAERFAMLASLVQADADDLIAWRSFLMEAERDVADERKKTDVAIAKLQQKTADGLAKGFAKQR